MTDIAQASYVGALRKSDPEDIDPDAIDQLITRRARDRTPRETANALAAEDKAQRALREAEQAEALRYAWLTYYRRNARNHTRIAARLEAKATALLERGDA